MPFASVHFLFLFLPATLLLYAVVPFPRWRNMVLVLASLIFFGWADPVRLPVLIAAVVFNYAAALLISSALVKDRPGAARALTWAAVMANLAMLGFFKYLGFFLERAALLLPARPDIPEQPLLLGVSYFTFSCLSYILDVSSGAEAAEKDFLRFSAYLVMFPKLLQGPITRFREVRSGLQKPAINMDLLANGARRFITGLAKKVILADSLAVVSDRVFGVSFSLIGADLAWLGLISYALQIYFDFSGYTDMAVGLGLMLGLKLPENFNFPYISRSIADFWRRWHMSLTAWFRAYVFIPLEFARKKENPQFRQQSNIFIVFFLTGLWHGANWNFAIWGAYFGLILALESGRLGKWIKKLPRALQHLYAISLILAGWIFFRLTNPHDWIPFMKALLGANGWTGLENLRSLNVLPYLPLVFVAVVFCLPVSSWMEKKLRQLPGIASLAVDAGHISLFLFTLTFLLARGFTTFLYAKF